MYTNYFPLLFVSFPSSLFIARNKKVISIVYEYENKFTCQCSRLWETYFVRSLPMMFVLHFLTYYFRDTNSIVIFILTNLTNFLSMARQRIQRSSKKARIVQVLLLLCCARNPLYALTKSPFSRVLCAGAVQRLHQLPSTSNDHQERRSLLRWPRPVARVAQNVRLLSRR